MSRKIFQDMLQPLTIHKFTPPPMEERDEVPVARRGRRGKFSIMLTLVVLLVAGVGFASFSDFFDSAVVRITPRQTSSPVDMTLSAYRGNNTAAPKGAIHFETVRLTVSDGVDVPATGTEKVERKATGTITIFNNYSSKPQKLVASTRFTTKEGLVYRIGSDVTIPGAARVGSDVKPGSIDVTVLADQSGAQYNISIVDFSIPGFSGSPRYEKIYARSKTEMTGGFKGEMRTADTAKLDAARKQLKETILTRAVDEAIAQTPAGYVAYREGFRVQVHDTTDQSATGTSGTSSPSMVHVTARAELQGVIVSVADLSLVIASKVIPGFALAPVPVDIPDLKKLTFELLNGQAINFETINEISFRLKGPVRVVWVFDENALVASLLGVPEKSYSTIFKNLPSVERADTTLSPFWARHFPKDKAKIRIEKLLK